MQCPRGTSIREGTFIWHLRVFQFVKVWLPLQEPIEEGERASLASLPTSSCLQGVWVDDIFNAGTLTTTPIIYKQNDEEDHIGTYNRLSLINFAIFYSFQHQFIFRILVLIKCNWRPSMGPTFQFAKIVYFKYVKAKFNAPYPYQ